MLSIAAIFLVMSTIRISTAEECPHSAILMKDGTIIPTCSAVSSCPRLQFVENCSIQCNHDGLTGIVTCERVNGTLVTTDPSNILSFYMTTTPSTSSEATTQSSTVTESGKDISTGSTDLFNGTYTVITTSTTIRKANILSSDTIIILVCAIGGTIVIALVSVSIAIWVRNKRTKVLPINPSKPRTKPNEPI